MDEQPTNRGVPVSAYSNHLRVGSNAFEFMLDFGQYREGDPEPRSVTRVVTSPAFAKVFLSTLRESIESYEQRFGRIPDVE